MNNGKTRASLMGIVAAYLLYTAYELFQGRNDPETTMTPAAMILFIALFVGAAVALAIYACRLWKRSAKEDPDPPQQEDRDSLK